MLRGLLLALLVGAAAAQGGLRLDCRDTADLIYDPTVCACGFDDANGREVRCAPPPPDLNQCLESVCNLETLQCQDWTHHAGCCQPTTIAEDCGPACDWICDAVDPVDLIGECVKDPASTNPANEFCCESTMLDGAILCPDPNACQGDAPICNANNQCEYTEVPFCCDPATGLTTCTSGPDANCFYQCITDPASPFFAHCVADPASPCSCDSILFATDPVLAMETCLPPNDCALPVSCDAGQCVFEHEPLCCLPEDITNPAGSCADANLPADIVCRQRSCLVLAGDTHGVCEVDQAFYPNGCCDTIEDCPDGNPVLCQGDPIACTNNLCQYEALIDCACVTDADCAAANIVPLNECQVATCSAAGTCVASPNPAIPACCVTTADCATTRTCETASCPGAGLSCVLDTAACCEVTGCPAGDACTTFTCNAVTGACESVTDPNCCLSDADCPANDACNTHTCNLASHTCETVSTQCPAGDACNPVTCNPITGACDVATVPGCCLTDAQCPTGDACTSYSCNPVTNTCDQTVKPDCCLADINCAGLANPCQTATCVANTCLVADKPNCCLANADCAGLTTRACETASCPAPGSTCQINSAGCCGSNADCPAGNACTSFSCTVASGQCAASAPTVGCCLTNADCSGGNACQIATCSNNQCTLTPRW